MGRQDFPWRSIMKRIISMLCVVLTLVLFCTIMDAHHELPVDHYDMIAEKYNGWSGVLRIWIYEGWKVGTGTVMPWLNLCSSQFEKNHEGVYAHIQSVDAAALNTLFESGVVPPDIILFPPGCLQSPEHLVPLENNPDLRYDLLSSGQWNGMAYAQPVLMGGYLWAYNSALLEGIPDSLENIDLPVVIPLNEDQHYWQAALMCLCSSAYYPEASSNDSAETSSGIDIGLETIHSTPPPSPTDPPADTDPLYCQLPDTLSFSDTAYSDFVAGSIAAMPVTQREIHRLTQCTQQGKAIDWQLAIAGDIAFSDQILYAALIDHADGNMEKQSLCQSFIQYLLCEKCQGELHRIEAFSVTQFPSGYPGYDPLTYLEYMMFNKKWLIVPAFSNEYMNSLDLIVRDFIVSSGMSSDILYRLKMLE